MKNSVIRLSVILCSLFASSYTTAHASQSKCIEQPDQVHKHHIRSTCSNALVDLAYQQSQQFHNKQRKKRHQQQKNNSKDVLNIKTHNTPICMFRKGKPNYNTNCQLERMLHGIYDHTFINMNAKVVKVPYDLVYISINPLVLAKNDGKYGFINNEDGKVAIPFKYEHAKEFSEGLAPVMSDGQYGFIDINGKMVIDNQYDYAFAFSEGLAVVVKNSKYGYIDKKGKQVIPLEYEDAQSFKDGTAPVRRDGLYGYIQPSGKLIIPHQFHKANNFYEGFAGVANKDNKFGFINTQGKQIADYKFDYVFNFSNGLAEVAIDDELQLNKKHGFMNTKGQIIIPMIYDQVNSFVGDYASVKKGNLFGVINRQGEEIVPIKYRFAYVSNNSFNVQQSGRFFKVDKQGSPIAEESLCYEMETSKGQKWVSRAYDCSK